jgi:hypothetical protein
MPTLCLHNGDARAGNGVGHHRFCIVARAAMETALLLGVPVDPKQKSLLAASAATRQLGLRDSSLSQ